MGTFTRGDQKSGLHVNVNKSLYATSCCSAEGHSSSSSHMRLEGPPQIKGTLRKPVGLDMPSYKCLCQMLCCDFPEVWRPNGSYSPSRPTWCGLRTQTLLLAEQRCARLVSASLSVHRSVSEWQGHGPCSWSHRHPSGIAQLHVRTAATHVWAV